VSREEKLSATPGKMAGYRPAAIIVRRENGDKQRRLWGKHSYLRDKGPQGS
jgi:hypothetical protein